MSSRRWRPASAVMLHPRRGPIRTGSGRLCRRPSPITTMTATSTAAAPSRPPARASRLVLADFPDRQLRFQPRPRIGDRGGRGRDRGRPAPLAARPRHRRRFRQRRAADFRQPAGRVRLRGGDITAVNELALALAGTAGRRLETVSQGNAFRAMIVAAWGGDFAALRHRRYRLSGRRRHRHGRTRSWRRTEHCQLSAFSSRRPVSIAVRLGTVTQPQGQLIIAALLPVVGGVAVQAAGATLDDLGAAVFRADLAAIRHETLDGRLFRT